MVTMTTAAFLCLLLGAAFAAPAEDKDLKVAETPAEAPTNQLPDAAVLMNFCPTGWFSYGSRCFLFVNSYKNWYSAEEHCSTLGGQLASVQNGREYIFLQQLTQGHQRTMAWLGGFNLQNKWMWIDRQGFYYTTWFSSSSITNAACTFLRSTSNGGNTNCYSTQSFICAKNPFGC
ncbi:ladderlectin-like [Thalassophryne amazonica]|uniref:ladderlectin-like n=1 Tax=Thalassophryne amazonica TaxID=390379 RepID=UPI0014714245|nr:ladderlectin-like [Thalassophryne amazonica]XP_034034925.1 ladderlectin-like [Thalassophryne amazonica]